MSGVGGALLAAAAALGYGAAVLAALRLLARLGPWERYPWAFAVGFGVLGWLGFPIGLAGLLSTSALLALCVVPLPALWLLGRPGRVGGPDRLGWLLIAVLAAVLGLDVVEALAPPSDADSLAYHFANPKLFLDAGGIVFIPRPLDGAIPMLVQMAYVPALAIGGERALMLWTMLSTWAGAALLFAVCRRHVGANPSLAVALVYLTMPAVVFGGGSGQTEPRLVLFALAAAVAVALSVRTNDPRFAALAGLAAGFFAGGKPFGLLFAAACGLVVVLQRRWFVAGVAFSTAALVAGLQWYAFLSWHTGDPVFPMLFGALGLPDLPFWTQEFHAYFTEFTFRKESPLPTDLWRLFTYPFVVTFGGSAVLEAARTGFGVWPLLLLPFALAGVWRFRDRISSSDLTPMALVLALFYVAWWFGTPSQRVRFLLPMVPVLLVCLVVPAVRWAAPMPPVRRPLAAAFVVCAIVQCAAATVFAVNPLRYLLTGESRDSYLERTVSRYPVVTWLNASLGPNDRVLHTVRPFNYLLEVPYYFANTSAQMLIDLRPGANDPGRLWRQLRSLEITHVVRHVKGENPLQMLGDALRDSGCAKSVQMFPDMPVRVSRTLPGVGATRVSMEVLMLTPEGCPYAA